MHTTEAPDGTALRYATAGPADGEAIALVGEAGFGPWQWGWQHGALGPFRTVAVDLRGTGPDAPSGPYSVSTLAVDLETVLADAGARRAHLLGFGLGGMVCLRHAREYGRARSLTLVGTAATGDAVDRAAFEAPFEAPDALSGLFTRAFREGRPDLLERVVEWRREEDPPAEIREAQVAAALSFEAGPLYELPTPALVLHALGDPVVPAAAGEELAESLPRGAFDPVEGRRLAHVEHSAAVNDRLDGFLRSVD
ncbi:MAG: alpha/beta fold hydrolase [Haloarculaceae archaeon]